MKYLVQFSQQHESFWLPELDTLLELNGADALPAYDHATAWAIVARGHKTSPFLVVEVPSEEIIIAVAKRAILIRRVLELWGEGDSVEEAAEAVKNYSEERKKPYYAPEVTWSIAVGSAGYSIKLQEQERLRMVFSFLPFQGRVRLKNPQHLFQVLGDYEPEDEYREGRLPKHVYFGREVTEGNRELVAAFDLKKRPYLGPTSMDNELALVMANMALAGKGKLCFDPFVGTGSILVACAHFGGFCTGTDIDIRVLKGTKGRNVFTNFDKYGLPRPELIRSDNALYRRHFREMEIYDCIVTDPPYGIRAGARKSGREGEPRIVKPEERLDHMPHTQHYPVEDVLVDLLEVAAQTLVVGGRLCYLLASTWEFDLERDLPQHPCLELSHHSVQGLSQLLCRRLITMTKTCRYGDRSRRRGDNHCHVAGEGCRLDQSTSRSSSGGSEGQGPVLAAAKAAAAAATAATATAPAADGANGGRPQPRRESKGGQALKDEKGGEGEADEMCAGGPGGASADADRGCTGAGVGVTAGGTASASPSASAGVAPPIAPLRERTRDMTKRGELTLANVWYATMRKDQGATVARGGDNAGGTGGTGSGVGSGSSGDSHRIAAYSNGAECADCVDDSNGGGGRRGDSTDYGRVGVQEGPPGGAAQGKEGGGGGGDAMGSDGVRLSTPRS